MFSMPLEALPHLIEEAQPLSSGETTHWSPLVAFDGFSASAVNEDDGESVGRGRLVTFGSAVKALIDWPAGIACRSRASDWA
jgi:hypothetical protein